MSVTLTDQPGGMAWSEDPLGDNPQALRIDFDDPAPHSVSLPRRGPIPFSEFPHADTLTLVREQLLELERSLGGPSVMRWRADGAGGVETSDQRLIDEPLAWGGGPGRGLPYAPAEHDRWSRANAGEVIPNVMTPLSWSVIADALDRGFHQPWGNWTEGRRFVALYDGYVYFNVGLMLELIQQKLGLSGAHFLEAMGGPEAANLVHPEERDSNSTRDATRIQWLKLMRRLPTMLRWLRDQDALPKDWPDERAAMESERDRLKALDVPSLSDREIFRELSRSSGESERQTIFLMRAQAAVFSATQGLLWATDRWLGADQRTLTLQVMQGLPGVRTQDGNIALRRIAHRAAADPTAAAFVQRESAESLWPAIHSDNLPADLGWLRDDLDDFMDEYGHRAAGELEAAEPRWVEQPELILDTFRDYVLHPDVESPDAMIERQQRARLEAEREIRRRLRHGPLGWLRWLLFRMQLKQARRLQPLRENPKFSLLELSLQQRRLWQELAKRWIDRGHINAPDDVYFLQFDELASLARRSENETITARMRSRIRRRRRQYELWRQVSAPPLRDRHGEPIGAGQPAVAATRGAESTATSPETNASPVSPSAEPSTDLPITLRGIAASTGEVEGHAHVADSPTSGRALSRGQILVARFTDPGWTPIFALAGAVVTEIGGVLSHGAIVAREAGIPAVVNVQRATTEIQSGDLLRVNGATGEVTILSRT